MPDFSRGLEQYGSGSEFMPASDVKGKIGFKSEGQEKMERYIGRVIERECENNPRLKAAIDRIMSGLGPNEGLRFGALADSEIGAGGHEITLMERLARAAAKTDDLDGLDAILDRIIAEAKTHSSN